MPTLQPGIHSGRKGRTVGAQQKNATGIPDVRAGPLAGNRKIGIKCEERRLSYGDKEHFENR